MHVAEMFINEIDNHYKAVGFTFTYHSILFNSLVSLTNVKNVINIRRRPKKYRNTAADECDVTPMAALLTLGRVVARRMLVASLAPVDRLHTINTV